ncbi:MAG: substrate-binding domain-containing protein [Verrucomicrobiota bacterium JB024]|jgi:LacI family transcriptional regulator|nr:substrate-binding domain-containing protein [Verrucomicrobiota bacterium JB024]
MVSKHVLAHCTWFSPGLRHGMRAYAREADWNLTFPLPSPGTLGMTRHYDGVILLVSDAEVFNVHKVFPGAKIVDLRGTKGLARDALVLNDNEGIGRMAADYLHGLGLRSLVSVASTSEKVGNTRMKSFEERAKELGCKTHRIYTEKGTGEYSYSPARVMKQVHRAILELGLPLGAFGVEDFTADLFTQAALDLGHHIPNDIAVLGCNNDRGFCESSRVPLSSIDVNLGRLGFDAAHILDQLMNDQTVPELTLIPPLTIEKRASTERSACEDRIVASILSYIRDHFAEKITAEHVVQSIYTSRATAYNRFSQVVGHPIGKEIERVRLENAKSLLVETDYKIDVVARLSGYTNTPAFCRTFRRVVGLTPGDYRSQNSPAGTR